MPTTTLPQNTGTAAPSGLDPAIVNVAKAIRSVESDNNFQAAGKSGEYGAYQFTEPTWNTQAQKLGIATPYNQASPTEQNAVAYHYIKDLKDQGYNVGQIASIWNSGKPDPSGNVGTNEYGASYDTPKYVDDVYTHYTAYRDGLEPPVVAQPSLSGFLGNTVKSGANFVGNIGNAILHPIDTVQTLGSIPVGGLQELGGQQTQNTQNFDSFVNYFKNRYGSAQDLGNTVYTDPIGFLADLSTFFTGAGGVIGKVGTVADIADAGRAAEIAAQTGLRTMGGDIASGNAITRAAQTVKTAGDIINPVTPLVSGARALAPRVADFGTEALGATTGAGGEAVRQAFEAGKQSGKVSGDAFTDALRGKTGGDNLLADSVDALNAIKTARRTEYITDLEKIGNQTDSLDISPVVRTLDTELKNFGVKKNADGSLDFSRSSISPIGDRPATRDIEQVTELVRKWGTKEGDRTPIGLDTLKKQLGDFYSDSSQARAFVTAVKDSVSQILKKQVPRYAEMTKKYEETSNLLTEVKKALSLGGKASADTTIRKLISTMKQNNEFRNEIIQRLEEYGKSGLQAQAAGLSLSPELARGLIGRGIEATGAYAIFNGLLHPATLPLLLASSPRLVGEFVHFLGVSSNEASQFAKIIGELKKFLTPAAVLKESQKGSIESDQSSSSTETPDTGIESPAISE